MPRIYELPAQTGAEPDLMRGGPVQRRQPQQPQGSANPKQMLANQMDMELNNVTREFDVNVSALDQQQLEPDKYKTQYANLQRQAMNQRVAIQAKHEAAAQQIKNMQKLVEDGILAPEQMQSTMLVMAGVPVEHVRRAFAQAQRVKPSTRLNELASVAKKVTAFRGQFDDERLDPWYKGGKGSLWYTDPTGKKRKASAGEIEAYDVTTTQLAELDRAQQEIFRMMTPMEQYAQAGSRAVERFGMGRRPMPTGRWGVPAPEPAPKKREPTAAELRKQGTREAYEKGIKLGYWD